MIETMNGMEDLGQLVHLQVKGNSQIIKEIRETQNLETKIIDREAIFRNEKTLEMDKGYLKKPIDRKKLGKNYSHIT